MGFDPVAALNVVMDVLTWGALTLLLVTATVLYAALISQRVHERRLRERVRQTMHLSAVVRTMLAEQRGAV